MPLQPGAMKQWIIAVLKRTITATVYFFVVVVSIQTAKDRLTFDISNNDRNRKLQVEYPMNAEWKLKGKITFFLNLNQRGKNHIHYGMIISYRFTTALGSLLCAGHDIQVIYVAKGAPGAALVLSLLVKK